MEAIRIEKVFDDPHVIRALVERHGPIAPWQAICPFLLRAANERPLQHTETLCLGFANRA